jgi:hypothetical protein
MHKKDSLKKKERKRKRGKHDVEIYIAERKGGQQSRSFS